MSRRSTPVAPSTGETGAISTISDNRQKENIVLTDQKVQ